jgi:hypothetical protein
MIFTAESAERKGSLLSSNPGTSNSLHHPCGLGGLCGKIFLG